MENENDQQDEHIIWEINKTKFKLARRRRVIELLRLYNERDRKRLNRLTSYKTGITNLL